MMTLRVYRLSPDGQRTDLVAKQVFEVDEDDTEDAVQLGNSAYPSCGCALCAKYLHGQGV